MPTVELMTATHIHALPGIYSVSDAECARLCALGVAVPCVDDSQAVLSVENNRTEPVKKVPKKARKK